MITGKNWSFVLFSVGLPVVLYLVFSQIFGGGDRAAAYDWAAMTMVVVGGVRLAGRRDGGRCPAGGRASFGLVPAADASPRCPPRSFLWAKAGVIMLLVLPALILVYLAGLLVGGVRLPVLVWLASLGLMWLALVPMAILGTRDRAVGQGRGRAGVTTLVMLLLAMLGGLWFPAQLMPPVMQTIAHSPAVVLAGRTGPLSHPGRAPSRGPASAVLLAWSAGLTVLGVLGYRRAVASSKR